MTLFPKTIEYDVHPDGSYDSDGVWVDGSTETLTFIGSVQPMTGKEIDSLQVGRNDKGKVKIYSDTLLPVSTQGGSETGAVVYWQDQKWEVIQQMKYQNDLINHYKFIGELRP